MHVVRGAGVGGPACVCAPGRVHEHTRVNVSFLWEGGTTRLKARRGLQLAAQLCSPANAHLLQERLTLPGPAWPCLTLQSPT